MICEKLYLPVSVLFLTRGLGWSQSCCHSQDTVSSVRQGSMVWLYWVKKESRSGLLALVAGKTRGATATIALVLMNCLSLIRKTRLSFSSLVRSATLFAVLPWSSWLILLEEAVTLQSEKVNNRMNRCKNEEWFRVADTYLSSCHSRPCCHFTSCERQLWIIFAFVRFWLLA